MESFIVNNWYVLSYVGLTGPEGVVCYDIDGTSHMVCVAYSVPYNDLLSDEAFNVKVSSTTLISIVTQISFIKTTFYCVIMCSTKVQGGPFLRETRVFPAIWRGTVAY